MAKSKLTDACDRLSEWLRRSNGNNAIADYMDKEAIVTLIENAQKAREPQLIRVFLDGGLVQAITNIPEGTVVRRIDLDVDGALITDTQELDDADMPPWANKRKSCRAFVSDFMPDDTSQAWDPQQTASVAEEPPPFGAVRFDGERRFEGQSNQGRAEEGKKLVALAYLLSAHEEGAAEVTEYADTINLDECPELPLTDLLLAVQHYAHRDQIPLYGTDGAWALAQKQFNEQSGGAAL